MRQPAILLLALIGLGCGAADPGAAPARIIVAASIPPHAWMIEEIGGDAVEVHTVLRPGESPTTHQPSDLQVSRVLEGRVFFRSGTPFESGAWFHALERHLEIVDLRDGVATRTMASHSHGGEAVGEGDHHLRGGIDPHIWVSPRRLVSQANHIAETLKRLDPARAADYDARLGRLTAELRELDGWIRDTLAPYRGRAFLVFHPSWGYFADDYGLRQIAIEIEGKEPSDSELSALQEETRSLGISVVFVQPQIAGKSAHAVAGVMGARLETLDPLAPEIPANLRHVTAVFVDSFDD